ncbi:MAG: hypothetical protein PHU95_02745 [Candidatus Thermoplasmatota archaeon]|nr:hypothetical protein [Candidatus Thermoplasmatota archaeon]MDD5778350.1 hypothetical protein [Candidatus Thermoplasmatota archaeon]
MTEMPVRYAVAVAAAGMAVGLMGYAAYQLWRDLQVDEARGEVETIVREAQLMQATADAGTVRMLKVEFPSGMHRAVFGAHNPREANRYYFLMDWGENHSYFAENVHFGKKTVLHSGVEKVKLGLKENGGKHVLIEVVE